MKKLIYLFLFFLPVMIIAQSHIRTEPLFWCKDTGTIWYKTSATMSSSVLIDTTVWYRSNIIDVRNIDSIHITVLPEDTICAKLWVFNTDGANFSDSSTTVVDSIKIAGRHMTQIYWKKIWNSVRSIATSSVGRTTEPWYLRFTWKFFTSADGAFWSAHKSRLKKFSAYVTYYWR